MMDAQALGLRWTPVFKVDTTELHVGSPLQHSSLRRNPQITNLETGHRWYHLLLTPILTFSKDMEHELYRV